MRRKRNIGEELLEGIREIKAGKCKRYKVDVPTDVKDIREKLNLSQSAFAALLGVSLRTLQDWEQGRRRPRGPAQSLLRIAAQHPDVFIM